MLSQQSKYALRAMLYLNAQAPNQYFKVLEIADKTNMPAAYLSKILKNLAEAEVIVSRRGKNGGVQINKKEKITFFEICMAVEDPIVRSECVLFKKACDTNNPCPFHQKWSSTKAQLIEFLKATRL